MKKLLLFFAGLIFSFNQIQAQVELLNNTNFSSSGSYWTTSGVYTYNSVYSSYHSATAYAYMDNGGGSAGNNTIGDLTQTNIFVPANTTALTLSFWGYIGTLESPTATTAYDQLHITLFNSSWTDYVDMSNMNWTTGYYHYVYTITGFANYVGTYVTVNFHGTEDGSNPTQFRIDDVSLMATLSTCTPVSITTQPSNQSATTGNTATFNVSTNGTAPITYQWYKNNNLISGANSSSYTTPTLTISDNGNSYYCKVTNCSGTSIINSTSATLTVTSSCTGASITTQPSNQSATTGNTASFSVNTNGTSPITYQWYKNTNLISGANSASYTTPILTISDNGNSYYCKVTNCNGTIIVNSNSAALTVTSSSTLAITGSLPSPLSGTKLVTYFTFNASITGYSASAQVYVDFYTPTSAGPYSFLMNNIGFGLYSYTKQMYQDGTYTFQYRIVDGTQILSTSTYSLIVSPQTNNTPVTLDPVLSHLVWPFPNSSWSSNIYDPIRDEWRGGEEQKIGGNCNPNTGDGNNCGGHKGYDYYADDWNRGYGTQDCHYDFLSPITGTVLWTHTSCPDIGCSPGVYTCSGNGNRVIVQSDIDNNYVFMVLHLSVVSVAIGDPIQIGTKLGEVGSTGNSKGSHVHCSLYRNINSIYSGNTTCKQRLLSDLFLPTSTNNSSVATKFVFDKNISSSAGGIPNSLPYVELFENIYNCNNNNLTLNAGFGNSYSWNTGDTTSSITINLPTNYTVTYFDTLGLGNVVKHFNVQDPAIILSQFPHKEYLYLCDSLPTNIAPVYFDTTKLTEGAPLSNFSFSWNTGQITSNIIANQPDTFYVTITDNTLPCSNSFVDTIIVLNANSPIKPTIQNNSGNLASNTYTNCTYQWFYNGIPIDSTNSQFHIADSIGYYSVSVTNIYGCSSTSDPVFISAVTEIKGYSFDIINIYPNPTDSKLVLRTNKKLKDAFVRIKNITGQIIEQRKNLSGNYFIFDLSNYANGIYFIEIKQDGESKRVKILKQ